MATALANRSNALGVNFNDVFTPSADKPSPDFAVGTVMGGSDGSEFVYVTTSSTIAVGDFVRLSTAWLAALLTTTSGLRGDFVGVSPVAAVSGQYFWVQRKGFCALAHVLASCAANARLNTTATAGALDDDGTATTKQVVGVALTTARAASEGNAPAELNYPTVDVTL